MEDNNQIVKDDIIDGGLERERVIKCSLSHLVKIKNKRNKSLLIDVIDKMVLKNSEIAVCCGIIMHHIVMMCVDQNEGLPTNFCKRGFFKDALNWTNNPTHPIMVAAINNYGPFTPVHDDFVGKPWLLGYLEQKYQGNIESSNIKVEISH